jgi:hypothetical protein
MRRLFVEIMRARKSYAERVGVSHQDSARDGCGKKECAEKLHGEKAAMSADEERSESARRMRWCPSADMTVPSNKAVSAKSAAAIADEQSAPVEGAT